jgi:hypothetical protein
MHKKYNCYGKDITGLPIELQKAEYGYIDERNLPHINWGDETDVCDRDGFDKTYRPVSNSESYVVNDYILPKGMIICRYGIPRGSFTTIKGTVYDMLGLPYKKESIEYHEYLVTEDLEVDCMVTKGKVASKFGSNGGAIQFKHKQTISNECEDGFLREVFAWKHKNI